MGDILEDERFKTIITDPKFKHLPKSYRKVKIDKRFQSMFTDKNFQLKYTVDKRGRPIRESQAENFKKYYELSSSENENEDERVPNQSELTAQVKKEREKVSGNTFVVTSQDDADKTDPTSDNVIGDKLADLNDTEFKNHIINETNQDPNSNKYVDHSDELHKSKIDEKIKNRLMDMSLDYARGVGVFQSDSSSDESTSEESEDENIEHAWGELDKDAVIVEDATRRLAVCHMDWDRITATDLMVLFNSFLLSDGVIESVTIYPSEFGLKRLQEEELNGPKELVDKGKKTNGIISGDEGTEGHKYHMEKLREYQLKRLKYYYAVVVCNSVETANKLYSECDGMEYESSATRLDLRFIPDDMTFEQEPKDTCTGLPDITKYMPRLFANTALQQGKVDLTWDETDPKRLDLTRKFVAGKEIPDDDLKAYIATSSSEEELSDGKEEVEQEDSDNEGTVCGENDKIAKYRSLLASIKEDNERKEKEEVEMEITWDVGLKDKADQIADEKLKSQMTPFEKLVQSKREKRIQKIKSKQKQEDDSLHSGNSEYSSSDEEIGLKKNKKTHKKYQRTVDDEVDEKEKAELELLLAEDEEEKYKKHFSLKAIQEQEEKKKKRKWRKQLKKKDCTQVVEDTFKIDVKDERFNALYTSHYYNIDPADPHFRKTKAMEDLIAEKQKRKKLPSNEISNLKKQRLEGKELEPELMKLVKSIKKNSKGHSQ